MIKGVMVKELKPVVDERGRLMEILRKDDSMFKKFGQVYLTTTYPGVVKAWHYHKKQSDNITCICGMAKLVLYDARKSSSTYGQINEFFIGMHNPLLIHIPVCVYHGFKNIAENEAILINIPDRPYEYKNPDEFRIDPYSGEIPYDWQRKDK